MRFQHLLFIPLLTVSALSAGLANARPALNTMLAHPSPMAKSLSPELLNRLELSKANLSGFHPSRAGSKQTQGTSASILQTIGSLQDGDAMVPDTPLLYDEYTFAGRADQQITISLTSTDFDTYLTLLDQAGNVVAENDDISQTNYNSRIVVSLPSNGVYTVLVNSYDPAGRGTYTLNVTTGLGTGDIQATLSWNTTDDLDLAIMDPNGDIVSFDNTPIASGGRLDVDANALCEGVTSTPVENIFWPRAAAPQGEYRIAVSLYSRCNSQQAPIPFRLTLQVQGSTEVFEGVVDEENNIVTFSTAVY